MRVLLVEDNHDLCASLAEALESEGFEVDFAYDGKQGLFLIEEHAFDVIILDINLPKLNGIEVCRLTREQLSISTPIIMLTARHDLEDKLNSFEAGADDYMVKPFEVLELLARIRILAKRKDKPKENTRLKVGDLELDVSQMKVTRIGQQIELSNSLRKLLIILMQRSPAIVSKGELEHALWGDDPPDSEILKIHIHNLRQKIDKPFKKEYLKTIRGSGYQLTDE